jgi:hypothetical protein
MDLQKDSLFVDHLINDHFISISILFYFFN